MSTLYHSLLFPRVKRIFQKLDHVSIYLLIAGTYTPYMLLPLWDSGGMEMLIVIWTMAEFGLLLDLFVRRTQPRSEEHTSELQSRGHLVCRLLLEKKKKK